MYSIILIIEYMKYMHFVLPEISAQAENYDTTVTTFI